MMESNFVPDMYQAQTDPKRIDHWFRTDAGLDKIYPKSIQYCRQGIGRRYRLPSWLRHF